MNCTDFKLILGELAAGLPVDAVAQRDGLSHAALCEACGVRLGRARGLVAALQTAAAAETEEAPARVKQTLLAAFREREQATKASAKVVEISSRRWSRVWVGVAAAAAAVLLALVLPTWLRVQTPQSEPRQTAEMIAPPPAPSVAPVVGSEPKAVDAPTQEQNVVQVSSPVKSSTSTRRPRRLPTRAKRVEPAAVAQSSNSGEFIPLTYLSSATAMESGTVVRVQLSRSALISLGLPAGASDATDSVKADLVIGDDGVARAIRLVE